MNSWLFFSATDILGQKRKIKVVKEDRGGHLQHKLVLGDALDGLQQVGVQRQLVVQLLLALLSTTKHSVVILFPVCFQCEVKAVGGLRRDEKILTKSHQATSQLYHGNIFSGGSEVLKVYMSPVYVCACVTWKNWLSPHCRQRTSERGLFWQYFWYTWSSSFCQWGSVFGRGGEGGQHW